MYISFFLSSLGFVGFFRLVLSLRKTRRPGAPAGLGVHHRPVCSPAAWLFIRLSRNDHSSGSIRARRHRVSDSRFRATRTSRRFDQASSVIRKRLDNLGTREISIQPEGRRSASQDPDSRTCGAAALTRRATRLSQYVAKLQFQLVPPMRQEILASKRRPNGVQGFPYQYAARLRNPGSMVEKGYPGQATVNGEMQVVEDAKSQMSGKHCHDPCLSQHRANGRLRSSISSSTAKAAKQFGDVSPATIVGRQLAIVLDGVVLERAPG